MLVNDHIITMLYIVRITQKNILFRQRIQSIMCGNNSVVESELIVHLNPIFLGQQIIFGVIGIFTNSYSLYYLLKKFNLSKIIIYKLLMACSIINIGGFHKLRLQRMGGGDLQNVNFCK